jgi:flagellar basal-body rod protein FlgB
VQPIHLFELASQQARWLSIRQMTVAENVANANTPGFKSSDVAPFEDVYNNSGLTMAATQPGHIGADPNDPEAIAVKEQTPWEITHSGNSVSVEQEMIKAGDINGAYSLNTSIKKAFHQMFMTSLKG